MNWSVFLKRSLSAIGYVLIMLGGILIPDPWAIIVLGLLIQFLCLKEFYSLMNKVQTKVVYTSVFVWIQQTIALGLFLLLLLEFNFTDKNSSLIYFLFPIPIFYFLIRILPGKFDFNKWTIPVMGILYTVLPVIALVVLRNVQVSLALALVVMIWVNDTMAYIVGSFLGKHKMSAISPGKTWEGTIGGGILTVVATLIWVPYSPMPALHELWVGFALIAVVVGTLGDLLESKIKRMAGVKDSGTIMPGHGGALDRFDSLLAALPFAVFLLSLFMMVMHRFM